MQIQIVLFIIIYVLLGIWSQAPRPSIQQIQSCGKIEWPCKDYV